LAHDANDLLTVIDGYPEMLLAEDPEPGVARSLEAVRSRVDSPDRAWQRIAAQDAARGRR